MQLLDAIGKFPDLQSLNLHQSALKKPFSLKPKSPSGSSWPPNLTHLRINSHLPRETASWEELITSLPEHLHSLAFDNCQNFHSLRQLSYFGVSSERILSVEAGLPRSEDEFPIHVITAAFPRIIHLSLPDSTAPTFPPDGIRDQKSGIHLQSLTFTTGADWKIMWLYGSHFSRPSLEDYILAFPSLYKLKIPEHYYGHKSLRNSIDTLEELLNRRAPPGSEEVAGLYSGPE